VGGGGEGETAGVAMGGGGEGETAGPGWAAARVGAGDAVGAGAGAPPQATRASSASRSARPSRGRGRGKIRFPHTSLRELMFTLDPHAAAPHTDGMNILLGRAWPSQTLPLGEGRGKPGFPTPLRAAPTQTLPGARTWGNPVSPHPSGLRPPKPSHREGETRFPLPPAHGPGLPLLPTGRRPRHSRHIRIIQDQRPISPDWIHPTLRRRRM